MKLKTKLVGAFSIVVSLCIVMGLAGIVIANSINNSVKRVTNNWLPAVGYISEIDTYVSEFRKAELEYIVTTDKLKNSNYMEKLLQEIDEDIEKYVPTISDKEEQEHWDNFTENYYQYLKYHKNIIELIDNGKEEEALQEYQKADITYGYVNIPLIKLVKLNKDMGFKDADISEKVFKDGRITLFLILVMSGIAAMAIALFISNSITRSVKKLSQSLIKVSEGDLTIKPIKIRSKDEIGIMAEAFNKMLQNLKFIVSKVMNASKDVGSSSEQLSAASEETTATTDQIANTINELASGMTNQAEQIDNTNNKINEIYKNIEMVADDSKKVYETSLNVSDTAEEGLKQADYAVMKIERIKEVSDQTTTAIKVLGEQSEKVGEIVNIIKSIAKQTNLLALNAAIEAARAGEHGKGFAVVSEEVRKLAEQASVSAEQIAQLVGNIQMQTENAVDMIEMNDKEIDEGFTVVNGAGKYFNTIVNEIEKMANNIKGVTDKTQRISEVSEGIVKSVESIAEIAEESAFSAEEVSSTTEEQAVTMVDISKSAQQLAQLGEGLQQTVEKFKY